MTSGRLTKYTGELVEKAYAYLENYEECGDEFPSHVGLALEIDVSRETLYAWAKDETKVFSDILDKCNSMQERILLNKGISGVFNSNITKLVLGKHGYHEKHDNNIEGGGIVLKIEGKDAACL